MLLTFVFILLPLQVLALPIRNTWIELSSLIILALVIYKQLFKRSFFLVSVFGLIAFAVHLYFSTTPLFRFISAFFWLSLAITILLSYSSSRLYLLLPSSIFVLLPASVVSILVLASNDPRPSATFIEPSFCGLYLSACLAYALARFSLAALSLRFVYGAASFLFLSALLRTQSIHIFSFIVAIAISCLPIAFFALKRLYRRLVFTYNYLFYALLFFLLLAFLSYFLDSINTFYGGRVLLEDSNVSALVWRHNLSLVLVSIGQCGFWGCGLGSTGYWHPNAFSLTSEGVVLQSINALYNSYDGYSLLFRLLIEVGVFASISLICLILVRIFSIGSSLVHSWQELSLRSNYFAFYCFSNVLIIGSFLKEPLYSSPFILLSLLLLGILSVSAPSKDKTLR